MTNINGLPLEGSVRREYWEHLNDSDMKAYARRFATYYQSLGFPYPVMTDEEKTSDIARNKELGMAEIDNDGIVQQKMNGLTLCWSYHPHSYDTLAGKATRTPLSVFNDIDLLTSTIYKRMSSPHAGNMSISMMRKALRKYNGVQAVSNFRPTAAGALYQRFASMVGKSKISTWDMCGGYGGRLLGAELSGVVSRYVANEPATETYRGLLKMRRDFYWLVQSRMVVDIRKECAESHITNMRDDKFDVCFTSPPYFNTEKYSDEPTQSYKRYPKYSEWVKGFLEPMLKNACHSLLPDGILAMNVANTRTAPTLVEDTRDIMLGLDLYPVEVLKLKLSGRPNSPQFKYEPILVMRKR